MKKRAQRKKSKQTKKSRQPQQIRHPISRLPLYAKIINEGLANTEEQYQTFLETRRKPYVLDDAIVNRAVRLYKNQIEDLVLFERQLTWWLDEELTDSQRQQDNDLMARLPVIQEKSEAILALLEEIQKGTIDRILEMDDTELGLRFLMGEFGNLEEDG